MPSADQIPVKSPHSTMHWHKWVVLIAGSAGSALRAVCPTIESENAGTGNLRQPFVTCVGDHIEQLFNTIAADWCDDAKLGKMRTDRVDHCGLLANEQIARAMEQQAALLFDRLGRHEPHVCSADRFANGLSVCSIALLPLDIGLHVGRRH